MAKPALDAGIVSADAAPLLAFYRGVFGMTPLDPIRVPGTGIVHKLACGQSVLRVMVPEAAPEPDAAKSWSARAGIRYLTFEVLDIAAAVAAVRAHGGRVELEPFELRPGRLVSMVFDPEGNMLEIGQG
jgi:catechol 2,3-dioxygenase-like lactoylglutathione lyase family enzyme